MTFDEMKQLGIETIKSGYDPDNPPQTITEENLMGMGMSMGPDIFAVLQMQINGIQLPDDVVRKYKELKNLIIEKIEQAESCGNDEGDEYFLNKIVSYALQLSMNFSLPLEEIMSRFEIIEQDIIEMGSVKEEYEEYEALMSKFRRKQ